MKILCAALVVSSALVACVTPAAARHRQHHHHHHVRVHQPSLGISFLHNYGPGIEPGTFAYYDGPLAVRCKQSAAAYRGQDGRAHPCN